MKIFIIFNYEDNLQLILAEILPQLLWIKTSARCFKKIRVCQQYLIKSIQSKY